MYINRSFLPFSFVSCFPYATTCLPACLPALVFCFVSLSRFYISPLVLVAILLYIYTNTFIPALVLPKRATSHSDPFVTLCCVTNRFRNTYINNHILGRHVRHPTNNQHACICCISTTSSSRTCPHTPPIHRRRRKVDLTLRLTGLRLTPPT